MFKIEEGRIYVSRGDTIKINLTIPITDNNGYIKFLDSSGNIYWYDNSSDIIYNDVYTKVDIDLSELMEQLYDFSANDVIKFNIYNKKGYTENPLKTKTVIISESTKTVSIELTDEDTTIGEESNSKTICWYDISLNDTTTIVGYDDNGAKEFIIYPAKGVE